MSSLRERVKSGVARALPADNTQVDAFINAADGDDDPAASARWNSYDKKAVPRTTFNLRLNDYELALLRHLAERRDESMQKVAKRVLIPALEGMLEERGSQ